MKKRILRYFVHIISTVVVLLLIGVVILLSEDGGVHYGDNPEKMNWDNDGPYVFFEDDSLLSVNYIKGNQDDGFGLHTTSYSIDSVFGISCYFNLDDTKFDFRVDVKQISTPPCVYDDRATIFAVSDIESGYKAFRDLLLNNEIIDQHLAWSFGNGHLVLVGDFVDRGFSTTQVLWFIYKLEQEAKEHGGVVHFIIGNHEIKNMQGNHEAASPKYPYIAYVLEKQQQQLYDQHSFLGKWLYSKNTMELINGHLFVHGGIHPNLASIEMTLEEMNEIVRSRYRKGYYPKREQSDEQLLTSTYSGPAWYRGYYKDDDLTQEQVDQGLRKFDAQAVIVGHTIQSEVNRSFKGKVIGIDVQHPNDYHENWPKRTSEALLIKDDKYYRALVNGTKEEI